MGPGRGRGLSGRWRRVLISVEIIAVLAAVGVVGAAIANPLPSGSARSICTTDGTASEDGASSGESGREDAGFAPDLVWADEFDRSRDDPIDPARWFVESGGLGWGEGELQAYTEGNANASYNGEGQLVITAREEPGAGGARYTSARLSTCGRFEFNHGRVEARIQIPQGQGLWPAFWTLGAQDPWPQNGEIDIFEAINDMDSVSFNTHQPLADGTDWELSTSSPVHPSGSWANGYHIYAVEWDSDSITWLVDGMEYARLAKADTPEGGSWVVDRAPQIIILNLAVGGFPGSPDATTRLPAEMKVDYVRVYANSDTEISYLRR